MQTSAKFLQKRLYTFLSTSWGIALCIVCVFWAFNSIAQLLIAIVGSGSGLTPLCMHCCQHSYADNLVGQSFEERLCLPEVDVVYTWVNGSDPVLQTNLTYYKDLADGLHPNASEAQGSGNRYRDNEELRYSLRSIWRFAPWVRKIFIVTNGQVPHWLDVEHPRLQVIAHSDIYPDKSHLPVFASPSIESHLHQIPGLADKFIYFNDDVMLGNKIWPDDFYTHSKGQKIFLSWDVPTCAPGCPDTWLGDRYCDQACNVDTCDFDGGDCANVTRPASGGAGGGGGAPASRFDAWNTNQRNTNYGQAASGQANKYCTYGCPTNWIGDKVCDRACKVAECGFDGGDCGLELIAEHLPGFTLTAGATAYVLPASTKAFYVNLTEVFPGKILEASHDNPEWIRTAVITQKLHLLTVVLFTEDPSKTDVPPFEPEAEFALAGKRNETTVDVSFNVSMPLAQHYSNFTTSLLEDGDVPEDPVRGSATRQMSSESSGAAADNAFDQLMAAPLPPDDSEDGSPGMDNGAGDYDPDNMQRGGAGAGDYYGDNNDGGAAYGELPAELPDHMPMNDNNDWVDDDGRRGGAVPRDEEDQSVTQQQIEEEDNADNYQQQQDPLPEVEVEGVPQDTDPDAPVVNRRLMSLEDWRLADRIANAKAKELYLMRLEDDRVAYETALEERRRENALAGRPHAPVWPWELKMKHRPASSSSDFAPRGRVGRKLLDTFADSLRHVNNLYNRQFGRSGRKVPAHMPHFIDKNIMAELQAKWPKEWEATSSHRFRHPKDMQFGFSYFYYLMHAPQDFDLNKFFREHLDLNGDGELDEVELQYLTTYLFGQHATDHEYEMVVRRLEDAAKALPLAHLWPGRARITVSAVAACEEVVKKLSELVAKHKKYKHELMNLDEVEFYMVRDVNWTIVQERLDGIRAKAPKFICLNDDMNKTADPDRRVLKALHDFFHAYYPQPSPFELPPSRYHQYQYRDDVLAALRSGRRRFWILIVTGAVAVGCLIYAFFKKSGLNVHDLIAGRLTGHDRQLSVI